MNQSEANEIVWHRYVSMCKTEKIVDLGVCYLESLCSTACVKALN